MNDTPAAKADLSAAESRILDAIHGMDRSTRLDRIEHVTAAHIEQARKDYEENRRIWREFQTEREAIWRRMEERDREFREQLTASQQQWNEQLTASQQQWNERGRALDERIGALVTAIGELIRHLPGAK